MFCIDGKFLLRLFGKDVDVGVCTAGKLQIAPEVHDEFQIDVVIAFISDDLNQFSHNILPSLTHTDFP